MQSLAMASTFVTRLEAVFATVPPPGISLALDFVTPYAAGIEERLPVLWANHSLTAQRRQLCRRSSFLAFTSLRTSINDRPTSAFISDALRLGATYAPSSLYICARMLNVRRLVCGNPGHPLDRIAAKCFQPVSHRLSLLVPAAFGPTFGIA